VKRKYGGEAWKKKKNPRKNGEKRFSEVPRRNGTSHIGRAEENQKRMKMGRYSIFPDRFVPWVVEEGSWVGGVVGGGGISGKWCPVGEGCGLRKDDLGSRKNFKRRPGWDHGVTVSGVVIAAKGREGTNLE